MNCAVAVFVLMLLTAGTAAADVVQPPPVGGRITTVTLTDERGRPVDLGDLLGHRPMLLAPVYFNCPNICDVGVAHLLQTLIEARLVPGRDLDVAVVSFDPHEGAADAAAFARHIRGEVPAVAASPVHFLTGAPNAVVALFESMALTYTRDAALGQFAHPAIAAVVSPDGRITAWVGTLSATDDDLRQAVTAAQTGRALSLGEIVLACLHGNVPGDARADQVMMALRITAGLTVLLLAAALIWRLRRPERPQA